ncbi:MAG: class II aldolase/adducin family protein [Christensenella sp.]|nr:class II aldolase/adducin family protein [Christensenella sp.]
MYEKDKEAIIQAALDMKDNRLITLSGGNVSVRKENGDIIVTPSGMNYVGMVPDDLIVYNKEGELIEGERKPSVDTIALQYIYEHMPEVNAIIHTHQPYATAVGLIADKLPAVVTTLSNVALGEVNVAPYSTPGSLEMGVLTVEYANGKRAVILKHHGVVTVGGNLKEALYAAVYTEDVAQSYLLAKAAGEPAVMSEEENRLAVEMFSRYGQ